jgi:hypothetical protein
MGGKRIFCLLFNEDRGFFICPKNPNCRKITMNEGVTTCVVNYVHDGKETAAICEILAEGECFFYAN